MTEEARRFAEMREVEKLRKENKIMRDQILEMSLMIESISTIINMYRREGFAVASSGDPLKTYEEITKIFPFGR